MTPTQLHDSRCDQRAGKLACPSYCTLQGCGNQGSSATAGAEDIACVRAACLAPAWHHAWHGNSAPTPLRLGACVRLSRDATLEWAEVFVRYGAAEIFLRAHEPHIRSGWQHKVQCIPTNCPPSRRAAGSFQLQRQLTLLLLSSSSPQKCTRRARAILEQDRRRGCSRASCQPTETSKHVRILHFVLSQYQERKLLPGTIPRQ